MVAESKSNQAKSKAKIKIYKLYVIPIALFVSFLWGAQVIAHRYILNERKADPKVLMIISSLVYMCCIAFFALYNWQSVQKGIQTIDAISFSLIAATAILGGFLANLLYIYILKDNESYVVGALINSGPVFTLLIAILLLKERVTWIGLLGVSFIIFGVLCLSMNEK